MQAVKQVLQTYLKGLSSLGTVEELIRSKFESDAKLLSEISQYLLDLGGKRIRPAICLMTAHALGTTTPSQSLLDVAAGIELIHMATLLHDDIIDNSPLRRHRNSPLKQYGSTATLLTGDFLLVRAFSLCARLDQYIINCTEKACIELTEGEILETPLFQKTHTIESSLQIATKKTASLFRLATQSAAHLSSKEELVVNACARFGENLGIAFQILDDVLDVISDEDLLGKKSGSDILERKPSIVNVLWLETNSANSKRLLTQPTDDETEYVENSIRELRGSEVVLKAKDLAKTYAARATMCLETLLANNAIKDEISYQALLGLVNYCIERME